MDSQALKGHLDMLVLAALEREPLHGYALIQELAERSDGAFDLPEGTVYPALHRLEKQGLLASYWSTHGGRRRRVYRLTFAGGSELERHRRHWRAFQRAVGQVIAGAR